MKTKTIKLNEGDYVSAKIIFEIVQFIENEILPSKEELKYNKNFVIKIIIK